MIKYICDRCKKEIFDNYCATINIKTEVLDSSTVLFYNSCQTYNAVVIPKKHYCQNCIDEIKDFISKTP